MPGPLVWDQHCCLPLRADADVTALRRCAAGGAGYVSVNVGYAPHDSTAALAVIDGFRSSIERYADLQLVSSVDDVLAAHEQGRLAVAFDLEDAGPLDGRLELVQTFYDRGVRTLLPTYNRQNAAGCGCMDLVDEGLSAYGRALVAEMNRVGMVVDGSHCSTRTGLDLCEVSAAPVVYSHSCMRAVWDHERNITDEQAVACAETGGVVGITGVGIFLGANDAGLDALVRHIDHAVELIGPDHVGFASDFPFDADDINREIVEHPELFPESITRWGPIDFMPPERVAQLPAALDRRGYPADAVAGILGGNFLRVACEVWRPTSPPR